MTSVESLVDALTGRSVVVVGDAMLDRYGTGAAHRLASEAPAPILSDIAWKDRAGGAANTAACAAALGANVSLVALAGADEGGRALQALLAKCGVATSGLVRGCDRRTMIKTRLMAGGQMIVRFDEGDGDAPTEDLAMQLADRLRQALDGAEAVIVSDYAYGAICPQILDVLANWRRKSRGRLIADARDLRRLAHLRPCAVTPNAAEAARLGGVTPADGDAGARVAALAGADLPGLTGAQNVVATLDRDGAVVLRAGKPPLHLPATATAEGAGVTGAGDTFAAALALGLAAGGDIADAARLACAAAGVAVAKPGTATCDARELRGVLAKTRPTPMPAILPSAAALASLGDALRADGARIVFTNGCFDLLHEGHLAYLEEARALGDVLVVGVNSDASVRRLKGPSRPVNACSARMRMLAALTFVDHVAAFDEDTPEALIRALRPHVFAKGGDYDRAALPEAAAVEELGGEVRLLRYRTGKSTTGIIARIRDAAPCEPVAPARSVS
ncbi:hypothetical protein OCGS_2179 [Oceaniovalibus guishaninsula JLT2003]|uniref:Bifunctional protein HldE n=1 Tax=Oceaniovalibus guishaninsula JLT2003 TaxID=1231392 RepID=K2I4L7_9RHOB|nr:D-glycero-beta-D-manno-heptose 1-phosphate adenylyltransferase [Oceaniovalibus guishaninsula]EKE43845.1 hypothetical protein OCGS_2179 [Oceaniovalibus guishaninsula JLT2003]